MGTMNIAVRQGETLDRVFTWLTSTKPPTPRDLTGYEFAMEVRDKPGGLLYASFETGDGFSLVDAAHGVFRLTVPSATTALWAFGEAVYDIKATSPSGVVAYPLDGTIVVKEPVTE
jgi:hypothetical protein